MCAVAGVTQFYIDAMFVEAEGVFKWSSTNETISYNNWAPNEPNNVAGNEQCVQVFGYNGLWNDVPCSNSDPIICQIPFQDVPGRCMRTYVNTPLSVER